MEASPVPEQRRYEIVVSRAMQVFGKRTAVAVWLARFNPNIGDGRIQPSEACRTARGFIETMAELERIWGASLAMDHADPEAESEPPFAREESAPGHQPLR